MSYVRFPYSVKLNGKHYAPDVLIEVDDATEYVKMGAKEEKKRGGNKPPKNDKGNSSNTPPEGGDEGNKEPEK